MPANIESVKQYVESRKYKIYKDAIGYDFSQHAPLIIAHKSLPHKLFSILTGHVLNRVPQEIENEKKGRRWLRLKKEYDEEVAKEEEEVAARQERKRQAYELRAARRAALAVADAEDEDNGDEVSMDADSVLKRMSELESKEENDSLKREAVEDNDELDGETVSMAVLERLRQKGVTKSNIDAHNPYENEEEDDDEMENEQVGEIPNKDIAQKRRKVNDKEKKKTSGIDTRKSTNNTSQKANKKPKVDNLSQFAKKVQNKTRK